MGEAFCSDEGDATILATPATRDAPFADALLRIATRRPDVVVLSADLSKYTDVAPFAKEFPERFVQVGMAEQNMMGVAGGLAKVGLLPIAVTYAVFATRRSWDQVAMALCTGPSRGIVMGFLPGLVTPFRATHQATDDLALMRAMPGMTVIDPADATELGAALEAAVEHSGSVYMRGLRGEVMELFDPTFFDFRIGRARLVRRDGPIGIISTGLATQWVVEASASIESDERRPAHLHVSTIKPLDDEAVMQFCERFERVLTVENHSIVGGLGSAVMECLSRAGGGPAVERLGVPDRWAPGGTLDYIRTQLGLDAQGLVASIKSAR